MSTFQCGDNATLVSYLYDECEPAERAAIEAHIAICAACTAEVAALGSARQQLAAWTPPEADLGFAIVRPEVAGLRSDAAFRAGASDSAEPRGFGRWVWFRQPLPAWAQAVAACLIFGAGLWLGVMRGMPSAPAETRTMAATAAGSPATVTATDLAALEQRLRNEMAELRAASNRSTRVPALASTPQPGSSAELLTQVRALIEESEQRQRRELALRTAQVVMDFNSQRQVDLAQIQRSFGQIEGLAGAEVREQREMLNYLLRVSEQR